MGKGYFWAACSIVLVSVAQVLMKSGMADIPIISSLKMEPLTLLIAYATPLLVVSLGILGYVMSMVCWFCALRYLPLSRAYPLLSLSYALVYLAAVCLPWLNESVSWTKNAGVLAILLGVWLINSGKKESSH
ncbi:4-amino-4-deoxy-L-arabinose-phosphoundecaprenol flippase subunit ArnF [Hafnia paralvei]|uniref:Probable 4-amino-4-deoxy-L-arabinose-phosphoundecaprenol flippase subunit ArnF n=1 Tax=Hafnia paralvei TaxID=546367 RepID=A0A2A2M8J7_9GAMM|nr:4-amino-4-deoxy-L-arabinose-phosphoundecaprenol flippase subunit ArnF [Hafnia paralvei]KHS47552.1 4-amino-4-deoxy-L-arabinose-phospho-UDP flippase [Hafnia paralvei]PAV94676.1 4-amino-4-deoxy-L-arabinose-phospho-UDP flippase [Hafnia paralvei]TBL52493.1 4-amino-4-deoxy-L-arabinose-phosphoundecaprenol flippase subunit ArnF [Hafnia paralvei]TBL99414.1 4-amino-4-deoxy-L-arabinose-phosphoundecaprenol flippase subunit ArnF [Hafnia paralvei]